MNISRFSQVSISKELVFHFIKFSLAKKYPIKANDISVSQVAEWLAAVQEAEILHKFTEETFLNTLSLIIENSNNPIGLQIRIRRNERQIGRLYWLINKRKQADGLKKDPPQLYDKQLNQQKYVDSPEGKNIDKYI
ncbi:MAG: hypothetical protein ACOWWO_10265 [Peptococcaceae bacterium]